MIVVGLLLIDNVRLLALIEALAILLPMNIALMLMLLKIIIELL